MTEKPTIVNLNYVYASDSHQLIRSPYDRPKPWMVIAGKRSKPHKTHAAAVEYAARLCGKKGRK